MRRLFGRGVGKRWGLIFRKTFYVERERVAVGDVAEMPLKIMENPIVFVPENAPICVSYDGGWEWRNYHFRAKTYDFCQTPSI